MSCNPSFIERRLRNKMLSNSVRYTSVLVILTYLSFISISTNAWTIQQWISSSTCAGSPDSVISKPGSITQSGGCFMASNGTPYNFTCDIAIDGTITGFRQDFTYSNCTGSITTTYSYSGKGCAQFVVNPGGTAYAIIDCNGVVSQYSLISGLLLQVVVSLIFSYIIL